MLGTLTTITGYIHEIFNNGTTALYESGNYTIQHLPMGIAMDTLNTCASENGRNFIGFVTAMNQVPVTPFASSAIEAATGVSGEAIIHSSAAAISAATLIYMLYNNKHKKQNENVERSDRVLRPRK